MTRLSWGYILLLGLLPSPSLAQGQAQSETTCSYDACSLHVHRRFTSTWIVRGVREEKTLKLGFTAAGMDSLVAASDSAVANARTFRHHHTTAGALNLLSVAAGLTAWLVGDKHKDLAVGLSIGSFGLGFAWRFSVSGEYMLRAYPIAVGPPLPAQFAGVVRGKELTLTVAVNDTVEKKVVALGPMTVYLGRTPELGPCPICRKPTGFR